MKREFSIYLDLVRFVAAGLVLIHHSNFTQLSEQRVWFSQHGLSAVIVFFALSGYVISYVSADKERDSLDYWSSRLSRFYSVALPIVLLCPLLDWAGASMAPQFYENDRTTHDLTMLRMFTSLTFLNEIWTLGIHSFSNGPYWSLNYEMWYYIFFAIIAFTDGRARLVLVAVAMLFVGPKILLLAPIWMGGVVMHRWYKLRNLAQWQYWSMFCLSWPLYFMYVHYHIAYLSSDLLLRIVGPWWHLRLSGSRYFLGNYLLALVVAANFIGFRGVAHQFARPLLAAEKPIRWLAGFTFSLYLLHQPLLLFYAAMINGDPAGRLFYWEVIGATLLTIGIVGAFTEHKRHRLKVWIRKALQALIASRLWRHGVAALLAPKAVGDSAII